jgi:hypothetical protein
VTATPSDADTPGPEATPEQDAAVRSLLGLLRPDDLPMPDDVARRIDAALAEERRLAGPTGTASAAGSDLDDPLWGVTPGTPAGAGDLDRLAPVTVLPARSGPSLRTFRILGGVAAAAAVILVGALVTGNGLHLGGSSTGAATSAPVTSVDASGTLIRSSGTAYSAATLSQQVGALVAEARGAEAVAGADVSSPTPGPTTGPAASSASKASTTGQALTRATLAACVAQLTGRPDVTAVALDHGSYDGKPADVVVVPTDGDPATLDVWVIAPGCTATTVDLYVFQRIQAR